jgi:hypothetical protein
MAFSANQIIGQEGELIALRELEKRGYKARLSPHFGDKNIDLIVDGIPTEVKFAQKTYRSANGRRYPRWQWRIHETASLFDDWLLILIAQDDDGQIFFYVLPGKTIGERDHLQVTSHPDNYSGWLNRYKNRFEVIDFLQRGIYLNGGPLLHQWGRAA